MKHIRTTTSNPLHYFISLAWIATLWMKEKAAQYSRPARVLSSLDKPYSTAKQGYLTAWRHSRFSRIGLGSDIHILCIHNNNFRQIQFCFGISATDFFSGKWYTGSICLPKLESCGILYHALSSLNGVNNGKVINTSTLQNRNYHHGYHHDMGSAIVEADHFQGPSSGSDKCSGCMNWFIVDFTW